MVITLLPKQSEVCGLLHADQCKQAFCYKAHWSGTLYLSVGSKITGWVKKNKKTSIVYINKFHLKEHLSTSLLSPTTQSHL